MTTIVRLLTSLGLCLCVGATDFIVAPFHIGNVDGPSVSFALNFGVVSITDNIFPVNGLQSFDDINNANFTRILYARGMATLVPLHFALDSNYADMGILNMWNASVAYCYKNYHTDHYGAIQLGAVCQERYVYGSTSKRYADFSTVEDVAAMLLTITNSFNKTAIEYDPIHPMTFIVYSDMPEVDNISTSAIPILLLGFFMSWLVWSQDITLAIRQPGATLQPIWNTLCNTYGVFIVDALLLCVCTDILNVIRGFAVLHGGDAIQLVGASTAVGLLRYAWAAVLVVYALCIVCIMAYGYSQTPIFQQQEQAYRITSAQSIGTIILTGVGTGLVLFFIDDIQSAPLIMLCVTAALLIALVSLFKTTLLHWLYHLWTPHLQHHERQLLLTFRWMLEFIILSTLHASLPTTLNGVLTSTYRNGVGFFMGMAMGMFEGRDITLAMYFDSMVPTLSKSRRAVLWIWYLGMGLTSGVYIAVFMLGPAFIASVQLEHNAEVACYMAAAMCVQSFALGSVYAMQTIQPTQ